jgi:hypothetical protein
MATMMWMVPRTQQRQSKAMWPMNEACNYSPTVATRVKKEMLNTYSELSSLRLQEQPLMVAGDASLFVRELEEPVNGISAYVYVKRFIGTELPIYFVDHASADPSARRLCNAE